MDFVLWVIIESIFIVQTKYCITVCLNGFILMFLKLLFWIVLALKLVWFNRRIIYEKLKQAGVPVPEYAVLNRDADGTTSESQLVYNLNI